MTWQVIRSEEESKNSGSADAQHPNDFKVMGTMYDFYQNYFNAFGELLTSMERNGIRVDTLVHLKQAEERAKLDKAEKEQIFMNW